MAVRHMMHMFIAAQLGGQSLTSLDYRPCNYKPCINGDTLVAHSGLKRVLSSLIGLVEFGHAADGTLVQIIFSPNVQEANCSMGSIETPVVQLTETLMPKDAELVTGQVMHSVGWCWLYR
jgi:hypothetical protein